MTTKFKITGSTDTTQIQSGANATSGSTADLVLTGIDGSPELARFLSGSGLSVGGHTSPSGSFHVASHPTVLEIDQSSYNTSLFTSNQYQSFTATSTGYLAKVALRATSIPYTGTLEIREGVGISGTLIVSTPISLAVDTDTYIPITCPIQDTNEYSMVLLDTSTLSASNTNPYAGGDSSTPGTDIFFKIYMKDMVSPPTILIVDDDGVEIDRIFNQNDVLTKTIGQDFLSGQEIEIDSSVSGLGIVHIGDNWGYSRFIWDSSGTITVIETTGNIADSDTEDSFCIYDKGTSIALKSNIAVPISVRASLHYSTITAGGSAAPPAAPTAPTAP